MMTHYVLNRSIEIGDKIGLEHCTPPSSATQSHGSNQPEWKAIAQRLSLFLCIAVMMFSVAVAPALAVSVVSPSPTGVAPGIDAPIPGENLSQMKQQRREWQSKASALNEVETNDAEQNESDSLGETLKERLNLEEIIEGYHPEDAEKTTQQKIAGDR